MIMTAADAASPRAPQALERVARRYWPAIFAFARSQGRNAHDAADITQGFLCDVLLARGLLASADPHRGRFRALLLRAIQNYMRDQHRRAQRRKRSLPGAAPLHLDRAELDRAAVDPHATPERAFSAQWGATLLRHVVEHVHQECVRDGLELHWQVFERRVLKPALFGTERVEYAALADQLGLDGPAQAANMVVTVKRRLARAVLGEVARTVHDPADAEQELRDLLRDLEVRG
jgi:RNA polymerase sigma-70 factor (ECF subfamily)